MAYCSTCGKQLPERAGFCPGCGAPVQSAALPQLAPSEKKRSPASAVGYWIGRRPVWTILLLLLFLGYIGAPILSEHREPAQPTGATAQPAHAGSNGGETGQQAKEVPEVESGLSPADKFALNLENTFKNSGYDIDARVDIDKALVLTSDIFKDASARETEAAELWKERSTLCGLNIWYVKVGYAKGMFSSDVVKTLSLGCLAEKAARAQEMASEREKTAASLNSEGIRASVKGTTMVFESDFFSEPTFRSQFVDRLVHSPDVMQKWCYLSVSQVQLTYKGKVVRTAPIACTGAN
jgi:zinc-ribbon domain